MKMIAALIFILFFSVIQYYIWPFNGRYLSDFPFTAGILQLTLVVTLLYQLIILFSRLRGKKISAVLVNRMGWIGLTLALISGLYWGAFGLAAILIAVFGVVYPKITRGSVRNPELRISLMLFLQCICLTAPLWFQLF